MWEKWSTVIFCDYFILVIHDLLIAFLAIHSKHFIWNTISRLWDTSWSKLLNRCLVSIFHQANRRINWFDYIKNRLWTVVNLLTFRKGWMKAPRKNDSHWYFFFLSFYLTVEWVHALSLSPFHYSFQTKRILFDWEINVTYSQTQHFAMHS